MAADQFQAVVSDLELAATIHRLFQMYDPSGNVVEIYAYLRNVREEILMH